MNKPQIFACKFCRDKQEVFDESSFIEFTCYKCDVSFVASSQFINNPYKIVHIKYHLGLNQSIWMDLEREKTIVRFIKQNKSFGCITKFCSITVNAVFPDTLPKDAKALSDKLVNMKVFI